MDTFNIINDNDRLERFDSVFIDWLGGPHVISVVLSLMCGKTYSEIEELHGVPRSTAHGWATEVKMKLRRTGFDVSEIERRADVIARGRHKKAGVSAR